ncbi:MAG: hypothetical protein QM477_01660 [Planctomycetota bacterium]
MRTLPTLLAIAIAVCAPISGQQTFSYGDDVTLPTFTPQGADHATMAVNKFGDIFVAWQGTWSGSVHTTEGMLMRSDGLGQWETGANEHFLLGDQSLHLISLDETCSKPDVVAMPDGSFCIAWHRIDRSGVFDSRLEVARIQARDALGALLPTTLVIEQNLGQGFTADPTINSGFAGIMVDLVNLRDGSVAAVYAHETYSFNAANGDQFREYDLRITRINWNVTPGGPGFISPHATLVSGLPIDNNAAYPLNGGQVLPDVVLDDNSDIVVAYEEYWLDGHRGVSGNNVGEIIVKRFSGFASGSPLQVLDTNSFTNHVRRHQRRPNLATSLVDAYNSVSLTWVDDEVTPWKSNNILSREITYTVPGASTVASLHWANSILHEDTQAVIAHGPNRQRYTFGVRFFRNSTKILIARSFQADMWEVPTTVVEAKRPAVNLMEFPIGSSQSKLVMVYEGSDSGNPRDYLVHLIVFRVP